MNTQSELRKATSEQTGQKPVGTCSECHYLIYKQRRVDGAMQFTGVCELVRQRRAYNMKACSLFWTWA